MPKLDVNLEGFIWKVTLSDNGRTWEGQSWILPVAFVQAYTYWYQDHWIIKH